MIAGKIIPAIATTTACITGFIGLEVMKHVRNAELDARRMATINLAVNVYSIEQLPDPIKVKSGMDPATAMELKAIPEGYTTWDFVEMKNPDITIADFLDEFKKKHHGCDITMLGSADKVFYDDSWKDLEERKARKLLDEIVRITGGPVFPEDRSYYIFDAVSVETAEGDDGQVPKIKWYFK